MKEHNYEIYSSLLRNSNVQKGKNMNAKQINQKYQIIDFLSLKGFKVVSPIQMGAYGKDFSVIISTISQISQSKGTP